jgi:hypothetical protein
LSFLDFGIILAFIQSRFKKTNHNNMQRIHKPLSKIPTVGAVRGAMNLWPLLKNHFTLELGSEHGSGSWGIPNCIRTDLHPSPGLDVICDATSLPFRDQVFDRTWAVYLAHHILDLRLLISEARRVSAQFYMFDFLPNTWLHYYSLIWDLFIFSTHIHPANPQWLRAIAPNHRAYKQSHLGSVLYVF